MLYIVITSFPLLNEHHLLNDIGNFEVTNVLSEFSRLYLSEVQKVLNYVGQDAC